MAPIPPQTKATSRVPQKINDLAVLPVTLPASKAYPHTAQHYLFIRPDAPKDADEISALNARSLFIANVPITASEAEFRALFKTLNSQALVDGVVFASEERKGGRLGVSGEVVVQGTKVGVPISSFGSGKGKGKKRKRGEDEDEIVKRKLEEMELPNVWGRGVWESGSAAVVRFVDRDAMGVAWRSVLRAVKEGRSLSWPVEGEGLGVQRMFSHILFLVLITVKYANASIDTTGYKIHHALTYPSPALLQQKVNTFLTQFSTLESLRNKQLASQRNIPDEEGFITVTRGGRTGAGRVEDAQAQQERLRERMEKRKREEGDFYRFQSREQRKKREGELKRRFEEERRRVGEMRGKRKVVPE